MTHHDILAAWFKMGVAWALYGLSVMTPLQWVQLVAALAATVYSLLNTYLLFRDRIIKRREKRWFRDRK